MDASGIIGQLVPTPTLAATDLSTAIVIMAAVVVGGVMGALFHRFAMKQTITNAIEGAEQKAEVEVAKRQVEADKEARERAAQAEAEFDRQRGEHRETERRLGKRETSIEKKEESLEQRDQRVVRRGEKLDQRETELDTLRAQSEGLLDEQKAELHKISGLSHDQALSQVLQRVEDDSRQEVAKLARAVIEKAEHEAREKAREITLQAIQRYAAETTSESTVRTVSIPSDDMKGRIIGREGRNIRAFEKVTGADIIVDDTPGVIVV